MFTLKVDSTGSAQGSMSWIGGIRAVHRIGASTAETYQTDFQSYRACGNCRDLAHWISSDVGNEVTLLSVEYDDGKDSHGYVICRRAWLLGPTGDTIERLAP